MPASMRDGSLVASVLDREPTTPPAPPALIEACSLSELGSRLEYLSVRIDDALLRPFRLDGSIITIRPDAAADLASAAFVLREAIELSTIGSARIGWPDRIVAHATAAVFAATGLRRRLADDAWPADGLVVGRLDVADLVDRPGSTVIDIARFLEARDRSEARCPESAIEAATRALPFALPTQVLLATGGDDRQRVDWSTGLNTYGVAPRPTPWIATFGSCTASAPTYRAFDAAAQLRYRLLEAAFADRLDDTVRAEADLTRSTILRALGVAPDIGVEVVLTPSGTDAELVALSIALAGERPLRSLLVAPAEIGRGSVPAAHGRHFSATLPSGGSGGNGEAVDGIDPDTVSVIEVPVRDDAGELLGPDAVEDHIDAELTAAPGRVLLHVVEGSKTGVRLPRAAAVDRWQRREGDRLDVVVDAAQMRINQATVVAHVDAGRMVFVTGSKFFGGPPFSGALLVPSALVHRLRGPNPLPPGLGDYLTRADVPEQLGALHQVARPGANLGLLARWAAALAEMRSFHNASLEIRDEVLRRFAVGLRRMLAAAPHVQIVESPYTRIPTHDERGLDDLPTIFTFLVRHPAGGYLDDQEVGLAHRLLAQEVTPLLDTDEDVHRSVRRSFQLGQPVKLVRRGDGWLAGLRIAIGATTVSQAVFDHTSGDHWSDRVESVLADVRDALAKLALIAGRGSISTVRADAAGRHVRSVHRGTGGPACTHLRSSSPSRVAPCRRGSPRFSQRRNRPRSLSPPSPACIGPTDKVEPSSADGSAPRLRWGSAAIGRSVRRV